MRILLSVEHPAWAHQFRYIYKDLSEKGHEVKVVAINKDRDLELLDAFGISYTIISTSSGKNLFEKGIIFLISTLRIFSISLQYKPDLFFGRASPMMAINSFIFRKPHIVFEDTEHSNFCLYFCKLFSSVIFTPNCFMKDLGKKQLKINAYKELFYLHPNYFKPDPQVLQELNLKKNETFFILRFVAWDAHHDFGQHGIKNKIFLVEELKKYGRILITSEGILPIELQSYQISISPEKLHDLIYFSTLYIGEGSTTASESAVLGTHAIYINTLRLGYIAEESEKYHLVSDFSNQVCDDEIIIKEVKRLLDNKKLKEEGRLKQEYLLKQKIDITSFIIWFIEYYPESLKRLREEKELQWNFCY